MNETVEPDRPWALETVQELKELAREKAPASLIALRLRRSQADVRAKASELGLSLAAE
ncbi:hypothetical protein [Hansschlegelia plantiphila]|uniref:Uncharacterized protein n=1 Tax=Hansschlegelia plantiphila TaxID=374655 RepID=A0A9W6J3I9_9HYPH|nr:hypothetical protein [Hansschlegelia plantiphila]GLK68630.1 hypothetical protein GCM10008179_22680 [Hansschlegelia plantiphila]